MTPLAKLGEILKKLLEDSTLVTDVIASTTWPFRAAPFDGMCKTEELGAAPLDGMCKPEELGGVLGALALEVAVAASSGAAPFPSANST